MRIVGDADGSVARALDGRVELVRDAPLVVLRVAGDLVRVQARGDVGPDEEVPAVPVEGLRAAVLAGAERGAALPSANELRIALDRSGESLLLVDDEDRLLRMTGPAAVLLGEHTMSGQVPGVGVRLAALVPALGDVLAKPSPHRQVLELPRRGGGRRWVEVVTSTVTLPRAEAGVPAGRVVHLRDVDARTRAERQALRESTHDALTGLPNRAWFVDRLSEMLHDAQQRLSVLQLDIDRFKVVNDALGPAHGDSLLVAFADRLLGAAWPGQLVARLGADEFAVLLPGTDEATARRYAEEVRRTAMEPFDAWGQEVFVSVSGGLAFAEAGASTAHALLRDANLALHEAKGAGGNRIASWDAELHAQSRARVQLLADLRGAIARQAFHLHYQPVVDLQTGALAGMEALIRWRHPGRGNVPPGDFIPLAEQTGLIVPLSRVVLEVACRQMRAWLDTPGMAEPLAQVAVAVNASARHFALPTFVDDVLHALAISGLPARHLEIEITESAAMQDAERAAGVVERLRSHGVLVSIDDFGSGYSSLAYLHRLPVDTLKIDRSLVSGTEERDWLVVRSILGLARHFGMDVVAEGVETDLQRARLAALGCDFGQGWLFARPMPAEELGALVLSGGKLPR